MIEKTRDSVCLHLPIKKTVLSLASVFSFLASVEFVQLNYSLLRRPFYCVRIKRLPDLYVLSLSLSLFLSLILTYSWITNEIFIIYLMTSSTGTHSQQLKQQKQQNLNNAQSHTHTDTSVYSLPHSVMSGVISLVAGHFCWFSLFKNQQLLVHCKVCFSRNIKKTTLEVL